MAIISSICGQLCCTGYCSVNEVLPDALESGIIGMNYIVIITSFIVTVHWAPPKLTSMPTLKHSDNQMLLFLFCNRIAEIKWIKAMGSWKLFLIPVKFGWLSREEHSTSVCSSNLPWNSQWEDTTWNMLFQEKALKDSREKERVKSVLLPQVPTWNNEILTCSSSSRTHLQMQCPIDNIMNKEKVQ